MTMQLSVVRFMWIHSWNIQG